MRRFILCLLGAVGATLWIGCGGDVATGAGGSGTTSTAGAGGASTVTTGAGGATTASTSTGTSAGSSASSTSTGTGTSATSSTGTGPGPQSGDCATDADCPGSKCVEVTPGGFKVCLTPPPEVTSCQGGSGGCCKSADCNANAGEKCYPPFGYCGGIVGPVNQCLSAQCQNNSDCAGDGGICLKAGMAGYPVNACIPAHCQHDSECTAQPGGECAPVKTPCCTVDVELYCVYPNGGCRSDKDCGGNTKFCVIKPTTQLPQCSASPPVCPQ